MASVKVATLGDFYDCSILKEASNFRNNIMGKEGKQGAKTKR